MQKGFFICNTPKWAHGLQTELQRVGFDARHTAYADCFEMLVTELPFWDSVGEKNVEFVAIDSELVTPDILLYLSDNFGAARVLKMKFVKIRGSWEQYVVSLLRMLDAGEDSTPDLPHKVTGFGACGSVL